MFLKNEAKDLFMKVCTRLSAIAESKQAIVIVTYLPERRSKRGLFFDAVLFAKSNVLVKFKRTGKIVSFILEDHPGQTVRYLVTDARNRRVEMRVLAAPLLTPHTKPDTREYLNMLISAAETLLGVFGYAKDKIRDEALVYEKQLELSH